MTSRGVIGCHPAACLVLLLACAVSGGLVGWGAYWLVRAATNLFSAHY
jgi:hypothetical protein